MKFLDNLPEEQRLHLTTWITCLSLVPIAIVLANACTTINSFRKVEIVMQTRCIECHGFGSAPVEMVCAK